MKDYQNNEIENISGDCSGENTYQITGNELIMICEAIQDGYILQSLEGKDDIMSVVLTRNKDEEMAFNFLR